MEILSKFCKGKHCFGMIDLGKLNKKSKREFCCFV